MYGSMAMTGRLATDPLGVMTQGETLLKAGEGYQTVKRWGDYASITVDPLDGTIYVMFHVRNLTLK